MQQSIQDEQTVRQLLADFSTAVLDQDGPALDPLLAEDYAYVTPAGVVVNKAQRLAAITAPNSHFDQIDKDEQVLNLYDTTAVEIARLTIQGQVLGQDATQHARMSTVLVKEAGRWQIVAQHFNRIP
ncbi:MAG: nuclear transport factor 2 family protein [Caldilineaceae bacterium]